MDCLGGTGKLETEPPTRPADHADRVAPIEGFGGLGERSRVEGDVTGGAALAVYLHSQPGQSLGRRERHVGHRVASMQDTALARRVRGVG